MDRARVDAGTCLKRQAKKDGGLILGSDDKDRRGLIGKMSRNLNQQDC